LLPFLSAVLFDRCDRRTTQCIWYLVLGCDLAIV